ncbi:helix-turn-helix domain-containing protein [Bifidobacterium amazonense]|uniref:Helix-turn-helix domain-containing protein n=1 Tax=Bifidobacterium amazonense TaxID=2809027 RepID=A0ABS9VVK5_9BIFI|nr:helix-turn-helix transcriptional regulator [Bifidobacterium amazonense]MCH9276130.1 helix-turn-helix domain-containing protein [Bifidobacterium amazonense]
MRLQRQNEETASRILKLISERGTTQSALADEIGITRQALSNKIKGNRPFTLKNISAIADVFEVSIDYLTGRIPNYWPDPWNPNEAPK